MVSTKRKGQALGVGVIAVAVIGAGILINSIASVGVGEKAVLTTFNKVDNKVLSSGYSMKSPFTDLHTMSIRQQKSEQFTMANVYNVDQQNVTIDFSVIYSLPNADKALIDIYKNYSGDPFQSFALGRIKAAVMAVSGKYSTMDMVKKHDQFKNEILVAAQKNVGDILTINDVIIPNITFDKEIEDAIKSKQIAQQTAQKAQYELVQAKVDAQASIVKATADATAKQLMAVALAKSPQVARLEEIKKWNGLLPLNAKTIIIGNDAKQLITSQE